MARLGMKRGEKARTSSAFGLFSSAVRRLGILVVFVFLSCGGAAGPAPAPGPSTDLPAIADAGPPAADASARVAEMTRLLAEARTALADGDPTRAENAARTVVDEHAAIPGSSEALWILARAAEARGSFDAAAESAVRFLELLPRDHPLSDSARLLAGRARIAVGDQASGTGLLLGIAAGAEEEDRTTALEEIRQATSELSFADLEGLAEGLPGEGWRALEAPILARYAEELFIRGRGDAARSAAEAALDAGDALQEGGGEPPEIALARTVLEGRVSSGRSGRMVLGALLPESGSPSERQFAALIREGIQARIDSRDPDAPLTVELQLRDDSGSAALLPGLLSDLGRLGTLGIVGPLTNSMMDAAIDSREDGVPLISPTVQPVPDDAEGVYSLNGLDPGGAELLARFARSRGMETAVILHAGTVEHGFEADVFREEYASLGGTVLRTISYPPGSTFFEEHLAEVQQLRPEALVLPVPVGDIELLAPQLTYFGLDTLGVRVFGTESWAEPEIREDGDPRHLNGIVVATPRPPDGEMPGWTDFVADYEGIHRQTLRSRVPALGYDAAGLLIEASVFGADDPEEVRSSLESLRDFPGATGYLSLVDGEIRRRYHIIRLREDEVIPLTLEPVGGGMAP